MARAVVWVSELKYVTASPLDCPTLQQLSESGEQREWYVYPAAGNAHSLNVTVYAVHADPLMMLNEITLQVTKWLCRYGIEANIGEIWVRSEQAVNDEIRKLIERLVGHGHPKPREVLTHEGGPC